MVKTGVLKSLGFLAARCNWMVLNHTMCRESEELVTSIPSPYGLNWGQNEYLVTISETVIISTFSWN